jgi:hypothetical protein
VVWQTKKKIKEQEMIQQEGELFDLLALISLLLTLRFSPVRLDLMAKYYAEAIREDEGIRPPD